MTKKGQSKESEKYEDMLQRVEAIVSEVSSGKIGLDHMVEKVEEGYGLIEKMRLRLDQTKNRIEKLRLDFEQRGIETKE